MKPFRRVNNILLLLGLASVSRRGTLIANAFLTTQPFQQHRHGHFHPSTHLRASLSGEEIRARLQATLARLREKDRKTRRLKPEEVKIVYEDDDLVVVDKPSGVLSVPSEEGVPSLVEAVFERCIQGDESKSSVENRVTQMNQLVVHRLGLDTSGLIVFAKTMDAVRGMNSLFRTRKITRQYEALVCGHVPKDQGLINLPLMRDYEHPPYMRISNDEHQRALVDLDPETVGKTLLEAPKASLTHFAVMSREYLNENEELPVTRVTLTSITGRTHQLNVHLAAWGHPIVQDAVYGFEGDAAPNGGLDGNEIQSPARASLELQRAIQEASSGANMCVHAKYVRFVHPVTKELIEVSSPAPF